MIILFFTIDNEKKTLTGKPIYIMADQSFIFEPWLDPDYSIMLGSAYISVDIQTSTGKLQHISGFNPIDTWLAKELFRPVSFNGNVIVKSDLFLSGGGEYYADNWRTFYDKVTGWVCIGNPDISNDDLVKNVEFAKDTIASIRNQKLLALWVRPEIVDEMHIY